MNSMDCGLLKMKYCDNKESVAVTSKEFNRENKKELLCYFKEGIVDFVHIDKLKVKINGMFKDLNKAIKDGDIIITKDGRYIKLNKNVSQEAVGNGEKAI